MITVTCVEWLGPPELASVVTVIAVVPAGVGVPDDGPVGVVPLPLDFPPLHPSRLRLPAAISMVANRKIAVLRRLRMRRQKANVDPAPWLQRIQGRSSALAAVVAIIRVELVPVADGVTDEGENAQEAPAGRLLQLSVTGWL